MRLSPLLAVLAVLLALPSAAQARTCAAYPNQAAAQRAADTRDGDGDGIYCEALPCPCLKPGSKPRPRPKPKPRPTRPASSCSKPDTVVRIGFSGTRYPTIRTHALAAIAAGWPQTLVLNRAGADARRDRLLRGFPTLPGMDRDEYPPAVGRGKGPGLERGRDPIGWLASVAYVPASENRSHGSTLGTKLRRYCDGTRFRYVFF